MLYLKNRGPDRWQTYIMFCMFIVILEWKQGNLHLVITLYVGASTLQLDFQSLLLLVITRCFSDMSYWKNTKKHMKIWGLDNSDLIDFPYLGSINSSIFFTSHMRYRSLIYNPILCVLGIKSRLGDQFVYIQHRRWSLRSHCRDKTGMLELNQSRVAWGVILNDTYILLHEHSSQLRPYCPQNLSRYGHVGGQGTPLCSYYLHSTDVDVSPYGTYMDIYMD
jgi:hypothetical protein